jgi:glutaminase
LRWEAQYRGMMRVQRINQNTFNDIFSPKLSILAKAAVGDICIPDFISFSLQLQDIYEVCRRNKTGKQATYIPSLGAVDPEIFGVSVCTIDGQRCAFGNSNEYFCIQSCGKVMMYVPLFFY